MNKYKTANGTIATEQELRDYYGVRFEEMLASGAFVKVEDGVELKKKVSPVLPMAPQQEQVPNAIPGVQPFTGSPSEDTSLDSQSSQSKPIPVRPTDVPVVNQQEDQTPFGVFNQKITSVLTPEEQARSVKIKYPTVQEEPKEEETPKEEKSTLESVGDWINNTAAALDRGFAKNIIGNPIKGLGTLIQGLNAKVTGTSGKEPITDALINFGNYYNKMIDELAPQDEEYKNSLSDQFAQAFGQVASLIATGGVAKAAGAAGKSTSALQMAELAAQTAPKAAGAVSGALETVGAQLSAPTSVSAGLSMGQAEFDRAKDAGATDEQAYEAFLKNASVGSILETIPVMGFLKRFDKATAGGVKNYLKTKSISGIVGGTEEMTTEILQQLYSNKTAKDIYDVNQDLLEGVGESGGVGFGVGFLLNAMGANAKILRKEGKETEAAIIEKQIQEFEEKPKGPPPSYKLNGITLDPEVAPALLDKMSGAELIKSKLEIKNDPVLELKIQDKIVTNSVKEQVRQGNPDLNEPSLNAITDLELQLQKLEGNKTQTGKDKAAAIRTQIKDIQENQIQEEAKVATIEAEAPEITTKRADKIAELETSIEDENVPAETKPALKTELETLKKEQDAIQKQATNESVLLSEQSKMGLQEMGEGNVQLEGVATRTEETLTNDEQKRKVELEEALKEPNTQNGTVTIGDQSITIEDAQKELDAFNKPTTIEQELTKMEERFGQQISSTVEPTTDQGISVTNKSAIDDIKTKTTDQGRVKVIEAAQRVLKTLKSVLPNFDIVLHNDEGSYNAAMSSFGGSQGTRGNFLDNGDGTGRIDINLSKANSRTVAHEVAHGVMLKAFGDTPVLFKEFRDKISKVLNESSNKELMDFAAQYEGDVTYEEYLAELTGRLEQQQDKLSTTTLQKIAAAINEIVSRLTNGTFKPFEDIKDTKQIVEFFNNISQSIRQGEEISPADIKAIQEGVSLPIGSPTTINKSQAGEKLSFTKEPLPLSFVTEADKIDINKLIDEIIKKKQTVWFWMADQLGRGNYYDSVIDGQHYLDAGPSFALDPKNRDKGVLWASGLAEKTLQGQIDKADYIFFISGSPEKAKLFNRRVLDLVAKRINKKSNFNKFKKALNNFDKETVELNTIKDALKDVNSFEELAKSPKRKSFLISINEIGKLKTTPAGSLKKLLGSFNAFVDYNELRDGFYKENGFTQNDIMLVGKPTGLGGKADHSTYESSVLGEVIGVPNVKINSWDIMPQELRDKYKSVIGGKEEKTKPMQTKVIAAETGLVRRLEPKNKSQISEEVKEMDKKFPISKAQKNAVDVVEKIINDARVQGFSEEAIKRFLEGKGLSKEEVKASMEKVAPTSGKITLSEQTLPGYDRMMQEADSIMRKSQQRGASNAKVIENVMNYVKGSLVYEKATDVQREKLVRDVNKMFGVKEKSAPSVGNILNEVKDLTKITMTEKQGLIKQIRDLARGAKDAKTAIAIAYEQLSKEIKELRGQGKLTVNQAANVLRKFSKVNVLSKTSVDRFTDYMTKVFENADYASKLSDAKKLKQSIAKLSKNKDKNADLRELGRQFSEIEPSMVENIEEYNEIAAKVKKSIQGSTIKNVKEKGNFAEIVNIGETSSYIKDVMDAQNEKIREERIAEIQDLMGIDASKFSAEEMLDLLKGEEEIKVNDEKSIKETAKNAFRVYASIIRNMINTGIDSFTGEEVEFTKKQKELVSSFIDMDLNLLDAKESVAAVDALTNFLQNNSTAKMEDVVSQYTGELNIRKLVKEGKLGIALRKLWSRGLARSLTEGGTTLPEVFTKIFKGARAGLYVATASGFNKIVNGNALANTRIQDITKEYIEKFFKTKPNGEKFNTAYNDAERGIVSDLMRSVIGTESEMQKEFERRKEILRQSIEVLSTGTREDQKKGKIYKKVYNNIVKGSDTVKDIEKKVDKTNLEAINFWMKTNEDIFPELYDYMLNVRNTMLEKDLNYSSPDRYVRLSQEKNKLLTEDQPMYGRNGELLIKKEAGGLMKAEHPDNLPKGMYRDYSFDKNNVNSLHDVLVDMNTGAAIRQLDAFKNSDYFDKLIPTAEDRDLLRRRFALYVSNIRNVGDFGGQDLGAMMKILDRLATIGVGMALGSPTQAIKQTVPLGINTMINASGLLKLGAAFNPAFNNFYHNSGYASANRGVESQADISSLNKKIETASNKVELLKAIENANKWWLKTFLVKPDVFIARASWQTFYEQELRKLGIDTKNLDYSEHKLNEDAADYAEMMVSRQQNVSDQALSGSWFTKKTAERKILTKVFLNMANFRMNSSSRLAADLSVLGYFSVSTAEDKAIAARSIAGYAAEQAVYRLISTGLAIGIGSIVLGMRGDDESEEDKKKRIDAIIKGQLTGSVMDVFSPVPFLDIPVKEILSPTLEGIEKATGLPLSIYGNKKQDYSNLLGAYGIPIQRAEELYDAIKLGTTGTYTDDFGKEKKITEEDQKIISELIPLSVGTVLGVMPSEVAIGVRDIIKFSKRKPTSDEEAAQKIENAEEKQEDVDQKIEALDDLRKDASSNEELDAIDEKIDELEATTEEKKVIAEENKTERELKKELLTDPNTGKEYDNESDLKRYKPSIYEKNFGEESDWYKNHQDEKDVEKKLRQELRRQKDEEEGYIPVSKKRKNSDGTLKRSTFGPQKSSQFGPQKKTSKSVFGPK